MSAAEPAARVGASEAARSARVSRGASVLADREYRGIVLAQATSECGDQIAAIALSYLVYGRSNSPFLAAATYAVTYVPWVLGSIVLSSLADRLPRRGLMQVCDLCRAAIVGVIALLTLVHGVPIGALIGLVLVSSFFSPPFANARSALLPDIFQGGPRYVRSVAVGRILQQVDQVFGFALGGVIVAAISPRGALSVDCGSFVVSFVLVTTHVRRRPAPADFGARPTARSLLRDVGPGLRIVLSSPIRRALLVLASGSLLFLIAPEALAIAYARQHHHGAVAAGLLTAAQPLGIAVGAWLFIRYLPPRRQGQLLLPLAATGAIMLALTCLVPPVWLASVLWLASGMMQSFMITTVAAYNVVTEAGLRGQANGLAAAAISVAQAVGLLLWGAIGTWRGAASGVAWAGVAGLLIVALIHSRWPREVIHEAWAQLEAEQEAG